MKRISFLLSIFIIFISLEGMAQVCPEDYEHIPTQIYKPNSNTSLVFPCKKKDRREFWLRQADGLILETTTSNREDGSFQYNLYRELTNEGVPIRTLKYDNTGILNREERFNQAGKVIFRFLRDSGRLEEFDGSESERKIRECRLLQESGDIQNIKTKLNSEGKILYTAQETYFKSVGNNTPRPTIVIKNDKEASLLVPVIEANSGDVNNTNQGHLEIPANIELMDICLIEDNKKTLRGGFIIAKTQVEITHSNQIKLDKLYEVLNTNDSSKLNEFIASLK